MHGAVGRITRSQQKYLPDQQVCVLKACRACLEWTKMAKWYTWQMGYRHRVSGPLSRVTGSSQGLQLKVKVECQKGQNVKSCQSQKGASYSQCEGKTGPGPGPGQGQGQGKSEKAKARARARARVRAKAKISQNQSQMW